MVFRPNDLTRRTALASAMAMAAGAVTGCQPAPQSRLDLWDNRTGPHLRGVVIPQRRVYPHLDGPDFLGSGAVGVPVTDEALARLADRGANLVILSHPGIYREDPPYEPDLAIEDALNDMIRRCELAGLFVVIGYRTGPGRSEFTFHRDGSQTWFPPDMINDRVWSSFEAQDGWAAMWRRTALRFKERRNLAGYLVMVEPNANQAGLDALGEALNEWDALRLAERVEGLPADWPALARRLAATLREVDVETPILLCPDGYGFSGFASLLDLHATPGLVLNLHDYSPRAYTHQDRSRSVEFLRGSGTFEPPQAERWCLGEMGVARWAPSAARYLHERIASLEQQGANWGLFRGDTGWRVYEARENMFNTLYGAHPDAVDTQPGNRIDQLIDRGWHRNQVWPGAIRAV